MKFIRPEIMLLISQINWSFTYSWYNQMNTNKIAIFDFFDYGWEIYKEKFISHFKWIQHKDDYFFSPEEFDKFKPKVWWIFTDRNSFNLFFIMYKRAKSLNKYWIKKYLFREYISSDELNKNKLDKLKNAIIDFYTNEEDINKYILWNEKFIYKDYSDEELEVLYGMWLFIKEENIDENIFTNHNDFSFIDITLSTSVSDDDYILKWDIFANDEVYNYFLYLHNNTKSFQILGTRRENVVDFLEKDKIWLPSAIKNIRILIEYVKTLDEIFSTPYVNLLNKLKEFNIKCKKEDEKKYKNEDDYNEDIKGDWFDKYSDKIYSNFELEFLSLFYDIDKIQWYTYYDSNQFLDSDYLENNEDNKKKWVKLSHLEYNKFFK